ncbi:hypothetical protein HanPI659440_Chr00c08g0719601 [Helianthus annuus]|nr:hypothetical protein HanPI659440_Chr00c08g0719601 [Helianthus annuus]
MNPIGLFFEICFSLCKASKTFSSHMSLMLWRVENKFQGLFVVTLFLS